MLRKFVFALVFATFLPITAFAVSDSPKEVVETAVNGVIHVLKSRPNQDVLTQEDRAAIRKSIEGYFDFREMAKRSLGKPWRKMTEPQRVNFVGTFRELLELSYGNRLSEYHDQMVEYGKVRSKGRIAIVHSELIDAEKKTPILYKLVHRKAGWRVYDIKVEGISMVSTFRSDFRQAISKKGLDGFFGDLKKQVEKLQGKDKT